MKKLIKPLLVLVVVIVALAGLNSLYIVRENEYAAITRFSKIMEVKSQPGLYFRTPMLDSVSKLPKNQMVYDLNPSEVLTGDKKAMVVDNYTVWKIDDPLRFVQTVSYISVMEERLAEAVYNAVKNTLGGINQTDIINSGDSQRNEINKRITDTVNIQLKNYGVSIISAEIKRLDLPEANEQAVCNRMISERQQMAASYVADGKYEAKKIENETDKEVSIIVSQAKAEAEKMRGEGENEYMRILSDAYNTPEKAEFYEFLRTLDAAKISITGDKTLILPKESPIARIFVE